MLIDQLQSIIKNTVKNLYPNVEVQINVEFPTQQGYGDFTSNVALSLAKKVNQSPRDTANQIVSEINSQDVYEKFEKISVEGPGFINFYLSDKALWQEAKTYLRNGRLHQDSPGKGKQVMVEFSSPNIAKPFNVGHLRSTIIGDSLARMYRYLGCDVLKDNHLGDWGTQYGKLAYAVDNWGDWQLIEQNPIPELFKLYVRFHQEEKENPSLGDAGREYFKLLEQRDPKIYHTWQRLVELSKSDFDQLYRQLNVEFDMQLGESFYEPMLSSVIEECKASGIARESEGALLIFFDNDPELSNTPLMIRKSNGTSTYGTRDLAGIKYRFNKFDLSKLIIEIGNEQQLYFKQIIKAAEMLGWVKPGQLVHVGHGLFLLPTGKMSTRRGETIWVSELIAELEERTEKIMSERLDLSNEELVSIKSDIALGALKYNDLSQNRLSNVVFDKEKSLELEGNSAPYLQYSIVRSKSVLNKSGYDWQDPKVIQSIWATTLSRTEKLSNEERDLLALIVRFDKIVEEAARSYLPNMLSNYLFNLSQKYNSFYQSERVLTSPTPVKESRLVLVQLTRQILANGLNLLGINTPSKM